MTNGATRGVVVGMAVRPSDGEPMREIEGSQAPVDGWLDGDHGGSAKRGITFLSTETWAEVNAELGSSIPWYRRRANVCVEGLGNLAPLVGKRIRAGEVVVAILDETRPCGEMDKIHQGLRKTLEVTGRGGVYGRVVEAGRIRVGDAVEVLED